MQFVFTLEFFFPFRLLTRASPDRADPPSLPTAALRPLSVASKLPGESAIFPRCRRIKPCSQLSSLECRSFLAGELLPQIHRRRRILSLTDVLELSVFSYPLDQQFVAQISFLVTSSLFFDLCRPF